MTRDSNSITKSAKSRRRSSGIFNRMRLSRKKKKIDGHNESADITPERSGDAIAQSLLSQKPNSTGFLKRLSVKPRRSSNIETEMEISEIVPPVKDRNGNDEPTTDDHIMLMDSAPDSPPRNSHITDPCYEYDDESPSTPMRDVPEDPKILNTPPPSSSSSASLPISVSVKKMGDEIRKKPRRHKSNGMHTRLSELDICSSPLTKSSMTLTFPFGEEDDKENLLNFSNPFEIITKPISEDDPSQDISFLSDDDTSSMSSSNDSTVLTLPPLASNEERTRVYWDFCYGKEARNIATSNNNTPALSASRLPPKKSCLSSKEKSNVLSTNHVSAGTPTLCSQFPEKTGFNFQSPQIKPQGGIHMMKAQTPSTLRKNVKFGSPSAAEFDTALPPKELTPLPPSFARERFPVEQKSDDEEEEEMCERTKEANAILGEWEENFDDYLDDEEIRYEKIKKDRRRGRRSSSLFKPLSGSLLDNDEDDDMKPRKKSPRRSISVYSPTARNLLDEDDSTERMDKDYVLNKVSTENNAASPESSTDINTITPDATDYISPPSSRSSSLHTLNSMGGAMASPSSLASESPSHFEVKDISVALEPNLDAAVAPVLSLDSKSSSLSEVDNVSVTLERNIDATVAATVTLDLEKPSLFEVKDISVAPDPNLDASADTTKLTPEKMNNISAMMEPIVDVTFSSTDDLDDAAQQIFNDPILELQIDTYKLFHHLASDMNVSDLSEKVENVIDSIKKEDEITRYIPLCHLDMTSSFQSTASRETSQAANIEQSTLCAKNMTPDFIRYISKRISSEWTAKVFQSYEEKMPHCIQEYDQFICTYKAAMKSLPRVSKKKRKRNQVKRVKKQIRYLQRQIELIKVLKELRLSEQIAKKNAKSLVHKQYRLRALNDLHSFEVMCVSYENPEIGFETFTGEKVVVSWMTTSQNSSNLDDSLSAISASSEKTEIIVPEVRILKPDNDLGKANPSTTTPPKQLFPPLTTVATEFYKALLDNLQDTLHQAGSLYPASSWELDQSIISVNEIINRITVAFRDVSEVEKQYKCRLEVSPSAQSNSTIKLFVSMESLGLTMVIVYNVSDTRNMVYSLPSSVTIDPQNDCYTNLVTKVLNDNIYCNVGILSRICCTILNCAELG